MDENDVIDFLEWLEAVFPDRIEFPDKSKLANGYINHKIGKEIRDSR